MAAGGRNRDYAAEYAARNARARAAGYPSYWQQRQTERQARSLRIGTTRGNREASELIRKVKSPPRGMTPAEVRRLFARGNELRRQTGLKKGSDAAKARDREVKRIARKLGYRDGQVPKADASQRIFYYH